MYCNVCVCVCVCSVVPYEWLYTAAKLTGLANWQAGVRSETKSTLNRVFGDDRTPASATGSTTAGANQSPSQTDARAESKPASRP